MCCTWRPVKRRKAKISKKVSAKQNNNVATIRKQMNTAMVNPEKKRKRKSYIQGVIGRNIPGEVCLHWQTNENIAKNCN